MNPAPGFKKRPDHRITTVRSPRRVQVRVGDEVIADTRNALEMKEGDYPVVYYIPRDDVKMERLERSSHHTYCPFKGDCSYWAIETDGKQAENAVWGYRAPYDEAVGLAGHYAFYPNRVDAIEVS